MLSRALCCCFTVPTNICLVYPMNFAECLASGDVMIHHQSMLCFIVASSSDTKSDIEAGKCIKEWNLIFGKPMYPQASRFSDILHV